MKQYDKKLLMNASKTILTILELEPNILEFSLIKTCIKALNHEFEVSTKELRDILKILENEKLITSTTEFEVKTYQANKKIDELDITLKQSIMRSINLYRNIYKHKNGDVRLIQKEFKKHLRYCNNFKEAFEVTCNFKKMYKFDICAYYDRIPLGTIEFNEGETIDCWYYMSETMRHFKSVEAFINAIYLQSSNSYGIFINYFSENRDEEINKKA